MKFLKYILFFITLLLGVDFLVKWFRDIKRNLDISKSDIYTRNLLDGLAISRPEQYLLIQKFNKLGYRNFFGFSRGEKVIKELLLQIDKDNNNLTYTKDFKPFFLESNFVNLNTIKVYYDIK